MPNAVLRCLFLTAGPHDGLYCSLLYRVLNEKHQMTWCMDHKQDCSTFHSALSTIGHIAIAQPDS